jgi:predicted O-methyltransferase YrrM
MAALTLKELCDSLEKELPLSNAEVFEPYDIPDGYPWKDKTTDDSNMYACLYGLAQAFLPDKGCILEIGTGWGISALTWLRLPGAFLSSLDCGEFEGCDNYTESGRLIRKNVHGRQRWDIIKFNTQGMYSPGEPQRRPWIEPVDLLFIDGDHGCAERPWALFSDLWRFWPLLTPGGLCICDDMHDPFDYAEGRFPWLPYTWYSFWQFKRMMDSQIEDCRVWKYPYVPSGKRPVGLLRKKS